MSTACFGAKTLLRLVSDFSWTDNDVGQIEWSYAGCDALCFIFYVQVLCEVGIDHNKKKAIIIL